MNIDAIRKDFPILSRLVHGKPLVYLDNAATTQKPKQVVEVISDFYYNHNSNVHRGIHTLSEESTQLYENARGKIASFIHANSSDELVFTKNTTEAINFVGYSWAANNISQDDEIIVTELEHHSNILIWQKICQLTGAKLIYLPLSENGDLAIEMLESIANKNTKLIAITQVSNVTGEIIDVYHLVKTLRKSGIKAKILIDGAQSVGHMSVNVQEIGIDFFAFSGHKMYGPMGIGCLWVKREILKNLEPLTLGGGMIDQVSKHSATWASLPDTFESGTPNVAGVVGLAAACDYLTSLGMIEITEHEQSLTKYAMEKLSELETQGIITLYGPRDLSKRSGIVTFNISGIHAHDVAQILDRELGVAVRSGHHCNQIILEKLKAPATVRASFSIYNNTADIDALIEGIHRVVEIFE